eukprot:m.60440 g.60440  ORF g.60440 m.60440 type:complete len:87 (-) comp11366_c0_seq4:6-266(-)
MNQNCVFSSTLLCSFFRWDVHSLLKKTSNIIESDHNGHSRRNKYNGGLQTHIQKSMKRGLKVVLLQNTHDNNPSNCCTLSNQLELF